MPHHLTMKEDLLLQDQMSHEKMCIAKYNDYAKKTSDPKLKQLFKDYAQQEKEHLGTIQEMLQDENFTFTKGNSQGNNVQDLTTASQDANQQDSILLQDLLMTEKYVSDTYNTAVFEFQNTNMRKALNHIQKEEQEHGEGLFNYMKNNGMYNPS